MDAYAHVRGVPLKVKSVWKETVRDSGAHYVRSLLRNKKELCSVSLEAQTRDTRRLTEIHFVCLPGQCKGEDITLQALSSLPTRLCELLRSIHIHSLKNDEVLLLKDTRWSAECKESGPQYWMKVVCVLRHNLNTPGFYPQANVASLVGLLGSYKAGIRYALELQAIVRRTHEPSQLEEDDTNQSVSSIEDDFVTAVEHLEEDDTGNSHAVSFQLCKRRTVASQTAPAHKKHKDIGSFHSITCLSPKKCSTKHTSGPEVSVTVQRSTGMESQWTYCSPGVHLSTLSTHVSESEDSDCSSPSPIIFLDDVGYQKSLLAKLEIPQVPGGPRERVEDSDSEVSEFFDSFDQFDDFEELSSTSCTLILPVDVISDPTTQTRKPSETSSDALHPKYVCRGSSTKGMNPQRFDQPILPADVKKPTPVKPGSPYSPQSELPDSPRPVQATSEENGYALFSLVSASAFSPPGESCEPLEYFWKVKDDDQNILELLKPQDLCSLYRTYSDFASNLSKEILGSVCGYQSAVDISENKNLICVCHKQFKNPSGYLMKLSEIQETVTVANVQKKSQSLKDGIQRFATDLVEMSLGSAFRDIQKGVSACTTTLCHLAARLTSSVFQMAFHEIGMRQACVLKEQAITGLASFLVGEAISVALIEFLAVKKQIFHNTVTHFAADLAEELIFEGIMEVCQFLHPSTPLGSSDDLFVYGEGEEVEIVSSYASDLSESVLQEAFIELSQANAAFSTQAAISVSLDNICHVSAEDTSTCTCSTRATPRISLATSAPTELGTLGGGGACTVERALFTVSGVASCISVPQAGQAISHLPTPEELQPTSTSADTSANTADNSQVTLFLSDTTSSSQRIHNGNETLILLPAVDFFSEMPLHKFSGNIADAIINEGCEVITAAEVKRSSGDCADFMSQKSGNQRVSGLGPKLGIGDAPDPTGKFYSSIDRLRRDVPHHDIERGNVCKAGIDEAVSRLSMSKRGCQYQANSSYESFPRSRVIPDVPATKLFEQRMASGPCDCCTPGSGRKPCGSPSTPPSTPQQPNQISTDKQIKLFSKALKWKLAKEFAPATPPPTPHYHPDPEVKDVTQEANEADFVFKLMRFLSEEADGNEDEDEATEDANCGPGDNIRQLEMVDCPPDMNLTSTRRIMNNDALHFAEQLACHIVCMATEMDSLEEREKEVEKNKCVQRRCSVAQFSEQTLNTMWVYAGEVAGKVINDVKRMVMTGRQCSYHKILHKRSPERSASDCPHHYPMPSQCISDHNRDTRISGLTEQWLNELQTSATGCPVSTSTTISSYSSGLSSHYPSCDSVTDEYAGHLIKVLKKEGGSRELILDHYASRLACRSIKLGLAHAIHRMKRRHSNGHLASSRSLPDEWINCSKDATSTNDRPELMVNPSEGDGSCSCSNSPDHRQSQYINLVSFAESLAHNITRDITQKLHYTSVGIPKSFTDSCLYKKSKLQDMTVHLMRNSSSCPLLSIDNKTGHHHSTGNLCDGSYNSRVKQVIDHYTKKIVDDTLEMSLASMVHLSREQPKTQSYERQFYSQSLPDGTAAGLTLKERTSHHCQINDFPQCIKCCWHRQHHKRKGEDFQGRAEQPSCLEIPKIHIHLEQRAAFADEMVSMAMEKAKRELSNTSLNADSGIGHDGTSYAESLTAEIMTSALSNVCQTNSASSLIREATESTVSQQLSVGDDSLGSWSNLSFEDEHPDDSSSFLHLSDSSNGNSSSWSSLGLEGECEDRLSFSPSDSDSTEDKETEVKEDSSGTLGVGQTQVHLPRPSLVVVNFDVSEHRHNLQLKTMLQWVAASMADTPHLQLSLDRDLHQFPAVVQKLQERKWGVGELLHALLRYYEETQAQAQPLPREDSLQAGREPNHICLFQWLLEHT